MSAPDTLLFYLLSFFCSPVPKKHPQLFIMSANTATTIYTLDDISKHNTKNDMWMTIHDKVYDISEFVLEVKKKKKVSCYICKDQETNFAFFILRQNSILVVSLI